MQRIVFVNLHADWMLLRVAMVYLFKFSAAIKHGYLLKYLLEHPEKYQVCNYINDRGFSLYGKDNDLLTRFFSRFAKLENKLTMYKNDISSDKIQVLTDPKQIRKDDIVIAYNIGHDGLRTLENIDAFKVISLIHFHGRKGEDADIKKAGFHCYLNETNLSLTSELFNAYYKTSLPWVIHPFVFGERFQNLKPFSERQNKCFSTGTITYKEHEEFLSVYGDPCDQPARKFVKDNPDFFKDTVDCYSFDYLEDEPGKTIHPTDNFLVKLYKGWYNRTHVGKQKKYFSFDMVEKFNDYKMHLLGEEILGVPGIGFVEGMACGSAYIGLDSPMYRDYGLIPGVHYITYDGTKEGLRATVEYYQRAENQEELEKIAKAGCEFVRSNFRGEKVAEQLLQDLQSMQSKYLSEDKN